MKDEHIHAFVALGMVLLYSLIDIHVLPGLAVIVSFYMWELSQRIIKDKLTGDKGVLYWWRLDRWGDGGLREFIWPAVTAILTSIVIYLLDHVFDMI